MYTSIPMIVADELEADWKTVRFRAAPAADEYKNPVWGVQATGGSTSIRHFHDLLRQAGAAGRAMLIQAAAQSWGVPRRNAWPKRAPSGTREAAGHPLLGNWRRRPLKCPCRRIPL